jgi:hypothetical protein
VDTSPRFRLVLERQCDKTEREGLLLPKVRSNFELEQNENSDLIFYL